MGVGRHGRRRDDREGGDEQRPGGVDDGQTLYIVVNAASATNPSGVQYVTCSRSDSQSLALRRRVALIDPKAATAARISDDGTRRHLVGPDGDVYIGVLEAVFGTHNGRGWLLHFDSTLAASKTPARSAGTTRRRSCRPRWSRRTPAVQVTCC